MPYTIIISEKAVRELDSLPQEIQKRMKEKLKVVRENPLHFFERLHGRLDFKLRVGDYRIIADIRESSSKIEITKVGHRKNVYQRH